MFNTKEIRWFFREDNAVIRNWFFGRPFVTLEQREDFYLRLKNENIGVKLRDGSIEVKHRTETRSVGRLKQNVSGYFENWIKWSFEAGKGDAMVPEILRGKFERWTAVAKERFCVQLIQKNGEVAIKAPGESLDIGCQIEYTTIQFMGEEWFTFGLEWSGEPYLEIPSSIISEILGNTKLSIKKLWDMQNF